MVRVTLYFPDDYVPGCALRQIILTLDPARTCGKDKYYFAIRKNFFKEKEYFRQIILHLFFTNIIIRHHVASHPPT